MRNNVHSIWTEERIAELRKLWGGSYSGSNIAEQMGCGITRNAVIGKAHRLGLGCSPYKRAYVPHVKRTPEEIEATRRRKNERRKERRHAMVVFFGPINRARPPRPRPVVCEEITPLHLSLTDLGPHQCRWPYGNNPYTFCGLDQFAGSSYCPSHFLANLRSVNRD